VARHSSVASCTGCRPLRAAVIYVLAATLWIILSDHALVALDVGLTTTGATLKGLGFVLVTGTLLYLLLVRDAMHLKKQRRELQMLTRLARHSNDILILEDDGHHIVALNERAVEAYGRTRESLLGLHTAQLLSDEGALAAAAGSTKPQDVCATLHETEHRSASGRRFAVEVSVRRVEIDGSTYYHSSIRDLSLHWREHEWLRLFVESPFVGMAITSPQSKRWVRFNDELCRILGYPREQLAGMTWSELTYPEDLEKDVDEFLRVLAGETEGYRLDKRFIRGDGQLIHAAIDVRCTRKLDRSVDYFFATIRDVTEDRETRVALQRSRDLYAMLSGMNAAVEHAPCEERLLYETCRIAVESGGFKLGVAHLLDEHAVMKRCASFVAAGLDGPDRDQWVMAQTEEPLQRVLTSGKSYVCNDLAPASLEETWIGRASSRGVRAFSAQPIMRNGAMAGVLTLFSDEAGYFHPDMQGTLGQVGETLSRALEAMDAHRAKQAAAARLETARLALEASEQTYRVLFVRHPAPMWVYEVASRRVLAVNESAVDAYGYSREEFESLKIDDLRPPEDVLRLLAHLHEGSKGIRRSGTWRHRYKDGTVIDAEVESHSLDFDGVEARLVMATNVSERLRAERSLLQSETNLRNLNHQLEERIHARTKELLAAKERAEASDHVKNIFLATVSHELRTPLNSVIGFSDLLLHRSAGSLSQEQEKQLRIISNSGHHLLALVSDFLDISKIEAGALALNLVRLDVREIVRAECELHAASATSRGLYLKLNDHEMSCEVQADPKRVRQVFSNLIANAIKFTDHGSITVSIVRSGQDVQVAVQDTGIGIPADEVSALFVPFKRIEAPGQRVRDGTGLGLAIARRLTEAMGGQIEVESTVGVGSCFRVSLPLRNQQQDRFDRSTTVT
jgi:PAS domain S-box-containing protein